MSVKELTNFNGKPNRTSIRCWDLQVDNEFSASVVSHQTYIIPVYRSNNADWELDGRTITVHLYSVGNVRVICFYLDSIIPSGAQTLAIPLTTAMNASDLPDERSRFISPSSDSIPSTTVTTYQFRPGTVSLANHIVLATNPTGSINTNFSSPCFTYAV